MSEGSDSDIATTYIAKGGTSRMVSSGHLVLTLYNDPQAAIEYWRDFIQPRIDAGDAYEIFESLMD